ncbi:MAG TPA: glucosylceramidase [Acholeplasmataceae bacterium]|nr:glucosylceramidase [Acholeplasmataceae bacterium]
MITIYETSKSGKRHELVSNIILKPAIKEVIHIQEQFDQTMQGFGGAFTEASAYNLSRVEKNIREQLLKAYFDPIDGIGYSMGRISINSCDFGLGTYDYVQPYDESLQSFDVSRDQHIIDMIKEATKIAQKDLQIIASPWSPPFWMKDNLKAIKGGKLLKKYYALWVQYIIKFIEAYKDQGITIDALTIQNEPAANQRWESCLYDAQDEKEMVLVLGKALKESNLTTKIYIWDHNRDIMFERASRILKDKEASSFIYGIAFHWYDNDQFLEVKKTHDTFKDKHLLFTEGCQEGGPHLHSYDVAERYGKNMMHDISNGTEGYIDWNLFLDTTGGPNHVNNLCSSPIMVDVFPETMILNPSYFYIKHFSKHIPKGSKRMFSSNHTILHNVFLRPDGSYVAVLLNLHDVDYHVSSHHNHVNFETYLPAHSIQTIIIK